MEKKKIYKRSPDRLLVPLTAEPFGGNEKQAKPFLKWAGGKNWFMPLIKKYLPQSYKRYLEPFLGGASIFFTQKDKQAILSDINHNLIEVYKAIKESPEKVVSKLKSMPYEKNYYYFTRDRYRPRSIAYRAARFIYLNRTCWNGLYRENMDGRFNVPFGNLRNPTICDTKNLFLTSKVLQCVDLYANDFEKTLSLAEYGDLIFIDPPYISSHQNNGFLKYNNKIFSWEDQIRLAEAVKRLDKKGCYILMTNANHSSVKDLYRAFNFFFAKRFSSIAASKRYRNTITELIIRNY
jgi:DNA adenine methylase